MPLKSHNLEILVRPLVRSLRTSTDPALVFAATVEAAYLVTIADGVMDATELKTLRNAVMSLMESWMDVEQLDSLLEDLKESHQREGHQARCRVVGRLLRNQAAPAIKLVAYLAYVSAGLDRREVETLHAIGQAAGLEATTVDLLTMEMRPDLHAQG